MQQQKIPKDVSTIEIESIPPLDLTPQSVPLLLTLPNTITLIDMWLPMNILSGTSNVVENTPMVPQRKSLIDITPIPSKNVDHYQVKIMDQGKSSKPSTHQVRNPKLTFQSMGPQKKQQQQHQPQVAQVPIIPSMQHTQSPLGIPTTYQKQFQL